MDPRAFSNHFLRRLPADLQSKWLQHSKTLHLTAGQILNESSTPSNSVYFPLSAVLSWVSRLSDGSCGAIALIGREGMVGLEHMEGMGHHLLALCAGDVLQLPAQLVQNDAQTHPAVQCLHTENMRALMAQASQTAICNQHHGVQQRLIRLLQSIFARADTDTIRITHEQLALLLGTRRERVSQATAVLQRLGLIRCSRGSITVIDHHTLFDEVCECCTAMRMPTHWPTAQDQPSAQT